MFASFGEEQHEPAAFGLDVAGHAVVGDTTEQTAVRLAPVLVQVHHRRQPACSAAAGLIDVALIPGAGGIAGVMLLQFVETEIERPVEGPARFIQLEEQLALGREQRLFEPANRIAADVGAAL